MFQRRFAPFRSIPPSITLIVLLACAAQAANAVVQDCANYSSPEFVQMEQFGNEADQANTCGLPCYRATMGSSQFGSSLPPQLRVSVTALGSHQLGIGGHVRMYWFRAGQPTVPCNPDFMGQGCDNLIAVCGVVSSEVTKDHVDTFCPRARPAPTGSPSVRPTRCRLTRAREAEPASSGRIRRAWILAPSVSAACSAASRRRPRAVDEATTRVWTVSVQAATSAVAYRRPEAPAVFHRPAAAQARA